jgi:hypothetical protein
VLIGASHLPMRGHWCASATRYVAPRFANLPHTAIVRFLDMGSDADILVPGALERLRGDPDAVGLLCAVLRAEHFGRRSQPELVAAGRGRVYTIISEIGQITTDLERLRTERDRGSHRRRLCLPGVFATIQSGDGVVLFCLERRYRFSSFTHWIRSVMKVESPEDALQQPGGSVTIASVASCAPGR